MAEEAPKTSPPAGLDECLKLLAGPRDEQRLAGLLVASKLCSANDYSSILKVYSAVGPRFLDRLLMTGMGKETSASIGVEEREAYLKLAVTVLAAFARVPQIASTPEMISRVPVVVDIMSKSSEPSIYEECYEFLLSALAVSEKAIVAFNDPEVMIKIAKHASSLPDGSKSQELSLKLLQLLLSKSPMDPIDRECLIGVSYMIASLSRFFGSLQNALKFDALHLLASLLSSKDSHLYNALRSMPSETWRTDIRAGIRHILQSHVVPGEKLQALLLAESMMSILGDEWLVEHHEHDDRQESLPADKFLLLVLESSRVEAAVLLNEIARLKYDDSSSSLATAETISEKQRNLVISFSVIEKIISLVSNASASEGMSIRETTIRKVIKGLDETIGLVLEFLQDSKDHGQRKGDDLLASVRIIGSYLAEVPYAWKEKTLQLLDFILTIEGEAETSPFYAVCFLLPMLCQLTMEIDGCKAVVSCGGHISVADCLVKMIEKNGATNEESSSIILGCDTIINILLNRGKLQSYPDISHLIGLLRALAVWNEGNDDPFISMISACICSLILELTSEESLLKDPGFDPSILARLSELITIGLNQGSIRNDGMQHVDLHDIVVEAYSRWADRFPHIRSAVENALDS